MRRTKRTQAQWMTGSEWIGISLIGSIILGIVVIVLLPIFAPAHSGGGPSSMCVSNLRKITLGIAQYASDSDDYLPVAATWATDTTAYSKSRDVYRCPSVGHYEGWGYAFRRDLSQRPWQDLSHPEAQAMAFDSNDLRWNAAGPLTLIPSAGRHYDSRRKVRCNTIAFLDLHVHWYSRESLLLMIAGDPEANRDR